MQPNKLTKEQQAESDARVEQFRKAFQEIVAKYDVDFISYPQYVPDPKTGGFLTMGLMTMVDKKYLPKPPVEKVIK